MELEELEGYEEMLNKFLERVPAKLLAERLSIKQRLEGLDPQQILESLPIDTLPDDVKQALIEKLKQ